MKVNSVKNIAVLGSHISWDGGVDFLCYMVSGIVAFQPGTHLSLILPHPLIARIKSFLLNFQSVLKSPSLLFSKKIHWFENKNLKIIAAFRQNGFQFTTVYYNYSEKDLIKKLQSVNADIVFPTIKSFGTAFPVPWVAYVPDLQHKHYPENFSAQESASRDQKYRAMLKEAKAILVNSMAAKNDLLKFYGSEYNNIFNLGFHPLAPTINIFDQEADLIFKKYSLPEKYFIICNQFWRHKDHLTAFKALAALRKQSGEEVRLVCTGKMQDDKDPDYFKWLMQEVKSLGVEHYIHLLGFIPKKDQMLLIHHSIALIQPTLFEGGPGGGSVYNAISYGASSIVSDIEINREIKDPSVTFFKASDVDDLKEKMLAQMKVTKQDMSYTELLKTGEQRTKALGEEMFMIFQHAAE